METIEPGTKLVWQRWGRANPVTVQFVAYRGHNSARVHLAYGDQSFRTVRLANLSPFEEKSQIEVGDMVHWTNRSVRGATVSMQRKDGRVVSVTGDVAGVRLSRNLVVEIPLIRLRLRGEKSTLTEFVEVMVESNRRSR